MNARMLRNTNKEDYGKLKIYAAGTIVAWRGKQPCIGRIKKDFCCIEAERHSQECAIIDYTHNSLHYSHLRLATEKEKAMLGKLRILEFEG